MSSLCRSVGLAAFALLALAALGGCGGSEPAEEPAAPAPSADEPPVTAGPYPVADISVMYSNPDAGVDLTYRISCQGDTAALTGDAVDIDERDACLALADAEVVERLAMRAPDRVCTQIYGGADVATISGRIDEQTIETTVDRADGCGINDWDVVLARILPPPASVVE